jgi:hypothetical protein
MSSQFRSSSKRGLNRRLRSRNLAPSTSNVNSTFKEKSTVENVPIVTVRFATTVTASSAVSSGKRTKRKTLSERWHRLEQLFCRHDYLRAFDNRWMGLRCAKCEKRTAGFTV